MQQTSAFSVMRLSYALMTLGRTCLKNRASAYKMLPVNEDHSYSKISKQPDNSCVQRNESFSLTRNCIIGMSFYVHGIFLQAKTCQFTNKCKSDKTVALNSEKQNNCTEIVMLYVTEMKFQLSLIFTKVVMTNITAILVINILIRLPVMYNVFTS